ncbi:hypothetical protein [Streptomyces swartbergensis]|uniref:Uncharacterized protein n=1 Tax=Streptomyces swartbergensis TaxID=487165 RepID=A0A243S6C5_9ACTN|nr:hypothetical protein [Streptomyces swartbergensis]OUD03108.1 hypothetical protein CA983_11225 [Streptomyces swartbergensis]
MDGPFRFIDATLIVGDQQIPVEADLGVFLPGTGMWGGILHHVPARLAAGMRNAGQVRLCLPTGQERRIRPLEIADPRSETYVSMPFVGEGPAP